ncbi:hypothetical protein K2Y11_14175 [bacterium]|nr:hypothetical protein [bacterium]
MKDLLEAIESECSIPCVDSSMPGGLFRCTVEQGSDLDNFESFPYFVNSLPPDLMQFWQLATRAILFEDITYGQWGLRLLSPYESLKETAKFIVERARECQMGDLIIGDFLGDSELLLMRCDRSQSDFGQVSIVLPIDQRQDWYELSMGLTTMLEKFIKARGEKH